MQQKIHQSTVDYSSTSTHCNQTSTSQVLKIINQIADSGNMEPTTCPQIEKALKIKYQLSFTLIGLVNNLVYVLILSSAQDIAQHFHQESFMSLLTFALILPSAGIIILNSIYLLKISHKTRIFTMLVVNIIGCAAYAFFSSFDSQKTYAFYICVAVALVSGANQSIGEGVMIAFIKKFPSSCISGWSSGTGFAGLVGAGLYLLFKSFNVKSYIIFSCIIPFIILYGVLFLWLDNNQPYKISQLAVKAPQSIIQQYETQQEPIQERDQDNVQLKWQNVVPMVKKIWFACVNILLVFFLQYTILTCFADVMNRKQKLPANPSFFDNHAYQILSFMYQLGVCLSRSSLYIFNIKKWQYLTVIQTVNFAGWFTLSFFRLQIFGQFAWMLFVGLIGGSSYVNIYYDLLENDKKILKQNQKQLAVNVILIFTSIGITMASLTALLLANTAFKT